MATRLGKEPDDGVRRLDDSLEHGRLVDEATFGKASQIQQGCIDQVGLPVENQIAENLSGRRGMHHSVPAKSVG